jgi:hypothetical protein
MRADSANRDLVFRPLLILLLGLLCACSGAVEVQDGDIIFHRSQSRQAKAIADATKSDYTHMGVIFFSGGKPYVYEAIQPVTRTPLDKWIERGVGQHYVIKRLKNSSGVDFSKVKAETQTFMGRDYDWLFEWSDRKVYCSELVWKAYERGADIRIGSLKSLKDFDLSSPLVRQIMRERYGNNPPLSMKVITPSDMFDSDLLKTVVKK